MSLRTVLFAPTQKEAPVDQVVAQVVAQHEQAGKKVAVLRVFESLADDALKNVPTTAAFSLAHAVERAAANDVDALFDELVAKKAQVKDVDLLLVVSDLQYVLGTGFNYQVAQTLDAQVVLVDNAQASSANIVTTQLAAYVAQGFQGKNSNRLLGAVVTTALDLSDSKFPVLAHLEAGKLTKVSPVLADLTSAPALEARISPAQFRYSLTQAAKAEKQRIVLPEGDEPRTVRAAVKCTEQGLAHCVLLAPRAAVEAQAQKLGVTLPADLEIVDPADVRDKYVDRLVELRKAKGMTEELAKQQLQDNVVLGTMMLEANQVDGLVSGAVHTTANTIRPPMQIIKTAPGASIISSCFFMLMPDDVYVFGDCAVNPNPTAAQLADIALQSAATAKAFGVNPRVAMISYSTINSGSGPDVDLVKEATALVKERAPELAVDGPLQYDAAVQPEVAALKAPNSPVAGKANVFIFPSLSVGNPLYKAVQRSADVLAVGPLLQGMRKPVNDLSRGALVEDIVYTICLTAVQSLQAKGK